MCMFELLWLSAFRMYTYSLVRGAECVREKQQSVLYAVALDSGERCFHIFRLGIYVFQLHAISCQYFSVILAFNSVIRLSVTPWKNTNHPDMIIYTQSWFKKTGTLNKYVVDIYRASLRLKYIPKTWQQVKVTFIPKAVKDDYTLAKSFRPISLTWCIKRNKQTLRQSTCLPRR